MSDLKRNEQSGGRLALINKLFGDQHADHRLLSFTLGDERFAIPLITVREVIGVPEFTSLPFAPKYVLGVINIRGQIITVIDLRMRLNMVINAHTSETALIVCESGSVRVAFLVDSINQVINPEPQDIQEKPEVESSYRSRYINLIYRKDKTIILLIDTSKILSVDGFMDQSGLQAA
jgi:purine-binding chemotaxis protein CheW